MEENIVSRGTISKGLKLQESIRISGLKYVYFEELINIYSNTVMEPHLPRPRPNLFRFQVAIDDLGVCSEKEERPRRNSTRPLREKSLGACPCGMITSHFLTTTQF